MSFSLIQIFLFFAVGLISLSLVLLKKYTLNLIGKKYKALEIIVKHINNPVFLGLLAMEGIYFLSHIEKMTPILSYITNEELYTISIILYIAIITYNLINSCDEIIIYKLTKLDSSTYRVKKSRTHYKFVLLFSKILLFIITIAAILLSVERLKDAGLSLLASAGVLTGIIALASKDIFSNFFDGMKLALSDIIKIGDLVEIDDNIGSIEKINLTTIILRMSNKKRLIIPAQYILNKPFINDTLHQDELVGYVKIYLGYATNITKIKEYAKNFVEESTAWDKKKFSFEIYDTTKENIVIRIAVSAKNALHLWELRCALREALVLHIQKEQKQAIPKLQVINTPA